MPEEIKVSRRTMYQWRLLIKRETFKESDTAGELGEATLTSSVDQTGNTQLQQEDSYSSHEGQSWRNNFR